jgi:hypothetical protein
VRRNLDDGAGRVDLVDVLAQRLHDIVINGFDFIFHIAIIESGIWKRSVLMAVQAHNQIANLI